MGIKCVVWDLDNTLWQGVLSEGDELRLVDSAVDAIKALDERGILNSIASRNDEALAMKKIDSLGLHEYFLYPEIGWGTKSEALTRIAASLNIGLDTLVLVDDDAFERAEVTASCPDVRGFAFESAESLLRDLGVSDMRPTAESRERRLMYLRDMRRQRAETDFTGPRHEFLKSLNMEMRIWHATADDLMRVEELVQRTNQLNSTGRLYSYQELMDIASSGVHSLLLARLSDRFGDYGTIGVALCEKSKPRWNLLLLLMSCRIMSRGVSSVMLNFVIDMAAQHKAELTAVFRDTGRNQAMFMAYKMAGFVECEGSGDERIFLAPSGVQPFPSYVSISYEEPSRSTD
ncbi:HAD-IIIC family phosphatase [Burkholderia pseudomallei]|uniref:HAD-IIIC family phosphatase n=1 Tax=Burkholderia pseudomallei TaxID=28450 RepID=UPI001AD65633|nr:HAD-IIIC family phosphatase [Burkholderia pseudomallei]MBO7788659.1 HAD-IIIC family phosphatase [Burkholderia pseudomallei]